MRLENRSFGVPFESQVDNSAPRLHHSREDYLGRESYDSFHYYSHPVDQTAPAVWKEMLGRLKGVEEVIGILKEDDTVCWSDQVFSHRQLLDTALTQKEEKADKVKASFVINIGISGIVIDVYTHLSNGAGDAVELLADYIDRNVTDQRENIHIVASKSQANHLFLGPINDYAKQKKR